jgi:predicted AlkP superfamily phosphohydrolase/phosphomutase
LTPLRVPLRWIWPVAAALLVLALAEWSVLALFDTADGETGVQRAYIGPGAGLALIGTCFSLVLVLASAVFTALMLPLRLLIMFIRGRRALRDAKVGRVVVIGLDGLEPTLTEQLLAEGRLPNLAKLKEKGGYWRLGTTWPPLSPVAWSSFATGSNPGKHNIYDFIARTASYRPTISSVRIREPLRKLRLGKWVIPLSRPDVAALRKSKPFWTVLGEHRIFSAIIRVPITFPPDKFRGVQLSAMCVPDLRGTQGTFSHFVEQGQAGATGDGDVGGDRILVQRSMDEVRGYLRGPANSLRSDAGELRAAFRIRRAAVGAGAAVLTIDGQDVPLHFDQHSEWVRVRFHAAPGVNVSGVCRFVLKRFESPFEMYCTPVQIDPDKPVMPIAYPSAYSSYLSRQLGTFSTLGLAEDTWSLSEKVLSEDRFLEQAYAIHDEREAMLFDSLEKVRRGLVVCVFDGPDRIQHMFWRFIDEQHPALRPEQRESHRHVIPEMYERMDDLVGRALAKIGDDDAVFVMSDHGFKSFRRGVDLNAWLRDNGYLKLKDGRTVASASYLADIDWAHTRAYCVGLAGIYLNLKGRENVGTVEPGEARALIDEIRGKLSGMTDPADGQVAVHEAVAGRDVYRGPYVENAPDIVVGYNAGYRVAWDAAIGKCGAEVFSDNVKAWSGDHCVHPGLVPGVLFSNRDLNGNPHITDIAATVLELLGVERPAYMDGKSLLKGSRA